MISLKNYALARLGLATFQRLKVLVSITNDDVLRPKPSTVVETEKGQVLIKKVSDHKTTATVSDVSKMFGLTIGYFPSLFY